MGNTVEALAEHGVVAIVDSPTRDIQKWAEALVEGGVRLFGVPAELLAVASVVDRLGDAVGCTVGVTGVVRPEQVSIAMAAGAGFVCSPVADPGLIELAKGRGLDVIAGAMTPTEVHAALSAGADLVAVDPAGALGPGYFASIARRFPRARLVAAGEVDIDAAPRFLELGAIGAIVDRGILPESREPAAVDVITRRARALVEVCEDHVRARVVITVAPPRPPTMDSVVRRRPSAPPAPKRARSTPPPIPADARRSRPAPPLRLLSVPKPPPLPRDLRRRAAAQA